MCELRLGNVETALELLHKAVEIDPKNSLGKYRLGVAYDEVGRTAEAIPFFEAAVEEASLHNPTINRLAAVYRRLDRPADVRVMYEKAVANNPYDVPATMGLTELEIAEETRESYLAAEQRLTALLDWMPENTTALTNLGVVRAVLGRTREAIEAYTEVLRRNPGDVTAALNLAQVYHSVSDVQRAAPLFERVVSGGLISVDEAIVVHDFFLSQGHINKALSLWTRFIKRFPDSVEGRAFAAWSRALVGDAQEAEARAAALADEKPVHPLVSATRAYIALVGGRYDAATTQADILCGMGDRGADARRQLLGALERFDRQQPDIPWTFCLTARLLIADGDFEGAGVFVGLCEERCDDPACRDRAESLRALLPSSAASPHEGASGTP